MNKRLLSMIAVSAAIATAGAALIACAGDGDDEQLGIAPPKATTVDTFIGAESQKTFNSEEAAVKAYFADELGGDYVGYEAVGELSSESIAELGLDDASDVEFATVVAVSFDYDLPGADKQNYSVLTSADSEPDKTNNAYCIKYKDGSYKYYSPRPSDGEAITRSYFMSLTNGLSYVNCAGVQTREMQNYYAAVNEPEHQSPEQYVKYVDTSEFKTCNGIIQFNTTSAQYNMLDEDPDSTKLEDTEIMYFVYSDGTVYDYSSYFAEWYDISDVEWSTFAYERIFEAAWVRYLLDGCYLLEKTDKGFKATDAYYTAIGFKYQTKSRNAYCEVSGGKIVKSVEEYVLDESDRYEYYKHSYEITDIGKVDEFALPDDILSLLNDYKAQAE